MSDPVTNVEIEDVLSSIRRLVSNGRQDSSAQAEPMDMPKKEPANRLVLTPSLRVDERQGDESSGIAPPEEEPHQIMSEPEDGSDGQGDCDESMQGEATIAADVQDDHDESAHKEALQEGDDAKARDDQAQADEARDDEADSKEASAPQHNATEPEGDIWLETAETDSEAEVEVQEDSSEHLSADHDQPDEEAATADEDAPQDEVAAQSNLEAQAAEFEAAVASRDDQWEPDGDSADEYAGGRVTSLSWSDARDAADEPEEEELSVDPDWAEADDVASARHEQDWAQEAMPVPPVEEWGDEGGLSLDDAVLDEEALRDMVSEIVRQELQGALGERITRNVRKLVRREIHRALTSQDMD
ncbi:hypothetical protein ROG8370_02672 [Roseovarius gaetbuli]|uniref:Uncharacterized protein n=1 Tax=Roseovarius gaetbuli TaxID=1356575 RepID=A0A1X6ZRA4_9RHOB|nr:hypothetical protein [Roseovarius gaetbuli]SLN58639.1 hypothetical protein ROG8370_02672 [Roseovarius gaetbuli]